MDRARMISLEKKWIREGKTSIQKARLRYYYRNRKRILSQYKSIHGHRDVFGMGREVIA